MRDLRNSPTKRLVKLAIRKGFNREWALKASREELLERLQG